MAHVHNQPRCQRCKEFRPTNPTQVGGRIMQLCFKCLAAVGWTDDVAVPTPKEIGPGAGSPPLPKYRPRVMAPPRVPRIEVVDGR